MKTAKKTIKDFDLAFYSYSYPCITVLWRGKKQPMGVFKTALEALKAIDNLGFGRENFQIDTPEKIINL